MKTLDIKPFRRRRLQEEVSAPAIAVTVEDPRKLRRANLVLGVVMAVTAVAVAITTVMQWLTMEAQTQQNEIIINQMRAEQEIMKQQSVQTESVIEQMRLEQRAWLGVQQPEIVGALEADTQIEFVIPVKNSGRTPGTVVAANIHLVTRPNGEDITELFSKVRPASTFENQQSSIAPDATLRFQGKTPEKMGADVLSAVTSRVRVLYVLGVLRYKDVLGKERMTQFCFTYDPSSRKLVAHEKHNFMN
ncbi:MAG: hypothetical protein ACREV5_14895 [Steroidobacter sp.]